MNKIKTLLNFIIPYGIMKLLYKIKKSIKKNHSLEKGVKIYKEVSLDQVSIGRYTYIAPHSSVSMTKIGKYCSIGPGTKIGLGSHPSKIIVSTHPSFFSIKKQANIVYADNNYYEEKKEIIIGNDVWVGANAVIKDGIKIGNGAIIGAGAVVIKEVEPYSIVGGVPAKLIGYRFTSEEIKFLQKFKWWDKSDEWLKKNWKDFLNIKVFIEKNKTKL